MDGFSATSVGVLVLAASNTPWAVDPAFRRPGRFDRVLFVPPPDQTARLAILTGGLAGRPVAPGLDMRRFAETSSGIFQRRPRQRRRDRDRTRDRGKRIP